MPALEVLGTFSCLAISSERDLFIEIMNWIALADTTT
jgi:hypothetical protein